MHTSIRRTLLMAGLSITLKSGIAWAAEPTVKSPESSSVTTSTAATKGDRKQRDSADSPKADNTGLNKRDRADTEVTADQQRNNKSDLQLTAELRRAIVKDKTLSMNAHNVKIIVQDGHVTLKGPVASQVEKASVEQKATDILGGNSRKVTSEIAIAP